MRIIKKSKLLEWTKKYANAQNALLHWEAITSRAEWKNFSDIKNDFNTTDLLHGDFYCFNIKGNDYRIICLIKFARIDGNKKIKGVVYLKDFYTHAEYSKQDFSTLE